MFGSDKYIRETSIIGPHCRERFMPLLKDGPLAGLGVTLAGVSNLRSPYVMYRPHASFSVVAGTLEGRGWLNTDEGERFLEPGDLMIAPKGVNHHYETVKNERWKVVWFNIGREIPYNRVCIRKADFLPAMAREFLDVTAEASAGGFLHMEACMAKENYLAVILQRILQHETRGQEVLHEARLQLLWRSLMNDLARRWRLSDLARIAGYSPEHLNRICNRRYGVSAMHYLTRLRMQHAAHLIGQGTHKILKIAELCGYGNPFAFSVAFKRNYGMSPRNFL